MIPSNQYTLFLFLKLERKKITPRVAAAKVAEAKKGNQFDIWSQWTTDLKIDLLTLRVVRKGFVVKNKISLKLALKSGKD